ncbi:hypothetical protein LZ198_03130 [Myxococcus sp. K15C18031901]|uniref:hypothetical protein n=1 Tax=Myxococcus dinghuensis TaxID=2906761 RepID=UPI0020A77462|nr:hypothetical protein [Myxococcus dinghuensis]MCP3097864.1 hypothetical protein [Myxococcus dinghuensis]
MRVLPLVVGLLVVLPSRAARAEAAFAGHLAEAVRLYEELEYELALEQLELAGKVSHGADEEVTRSLYKGLISADLGRWAAARAAFRAALILDLDARLPVRTAPKVVAAFESQLAKVRAERGRKRTDTSRLAKTRPPVPEHLMSPESDAVAPFSSEAPAQVARVDLMPVRPDGTSMAEMAVEERSTTRGVPVLSMVLLGVGAATGGVGTYYGLTSRSQLDSGRGMRFVDEMAGSHAQARRNATTANVLFGTAGLAVAGAVVTWLLAGDTGATATAQEY